MLENTNIKWWYGIQSLHGNNLVVFTGKTCAGISFLIKVAGLRAYYCTEKRLKHGFFL